MVAIFKGREANRTKNVDIKFSHFGIQYNVGRSIEIVGTLYYIKIKRLLRKRLWWWSSYGTCRWFVTTYAISAYHHLSCEFESRSWRRVLVTTLCDKVCQWPARSRWFSPGIPVSSNNKTDRHDITEILLNVALNTITPD